VLTERCLRGGFFEKEVENGTFFNHEWTQRENQTDSEPEKFHQSINPRGLVEAALFQKRNVCRRNVDHVNVQSFQSLQSCLNNWPTVFELLPLV
jgi:hypothetical protein